MTPPASPPPTAASAGESTPSSGGNSTTWDEHLRPAWWWWIVAVAMWLSVFVAVWAYLGGRWGVGITIAIALFTGAWIVQFGLRTHGDARGFRAGRNLIEWQWLSGAHPLDAEATTARLDGSAHHDDFLATRSYVPTAVVLDVADPADPHPAWVVATRRPEQLAAFASARIAACRVAAASGDQAGGQA